MALTRVKSGGLSGAVDSDALADDAVTSDKLDTNIDIAGTLDVTGAATFDADAQYGGNPSGGAAVGVKVTDDGFIHTCRSVGT